MSGEGIAVGEWLIPEWQLEERFDPYGGPGGQHANKTATAVTLRFEVEGSTLPEEIRAKLSSRLGRVVEVTVAETRSQWQNRAIARERMAAKLERALAEPKPRKKTKPSRKARDTRLEEKKARSELKRSRRRPEAE